MSNPNDTILLKSYDFKLETITKTVTQTSIAKPLGEVLLETGLVSAKQIEEALQEQNQDSGQRLGEILARRGWLKQETANFFADRWPRYLSQRRKQPIGQYLRDASLLDWQQVKSILQEQSQTGTKFGELIIQKGWLNQDTIDFFLSSIDSESALEDINQKIETESSQNAKREQALREQVLNNQHCDPYLLLLTYQKTLWHEVIKNPDSAEQAELLKLGLLVDQNDQSVIANPDYQALFNTDWIDQELGKLRPFEQVRVKLFNLGERASVPFAVLEEVFFWTSREPFLTQFICHAIYDAGNSIPANEERERVAQVVQLHVIENWSQKVVAKHFHKIIDQLKHSDLNTVDLLTRYRQVLRQEAIATPNDLEQKELLKLGLITHEQEHSSVANRIYAAVFNEQWVTEEIEKQKISSAPQSSALVVSPPAQSSLLALKPEKRGKKGAKPGIKIGTLLFGLLFLTVISTLLAIFTQKLLSNRTATRNFDQGNDLLNQGQHEAAIEKYNDVLSVDGNYHQAWTNRGYAFAGVGKYPQMLSSCRSATIIDPKAVYAWNCQGEALHNLQQHEEAIAAFDQAIELDPSDPVFSINKSESLLALEKFDSALTASQTAIESLEKIEGQNTDSGMGKNELAIAWSTNGRVFQNTQRYSEALESYEKSLTYNSNYYPAQLGKGIVLKNLTQYEAANDQFQKALTQPLTENQKAEVWFYSGLNYCKLWQTDKAMDAYNNALKFKPDFKAAQAAKENFCP